MTDGAVGSARAQPFGAAARLGWMVALFVLVIDQAFKAWMLFVYEITARGPIQVTSFFDLVLVWNRGISYGWFTQHSDEGRWLLIGLSLVVTVALIIWLGRTQRVLTIVALGMIIGGAIGNMIDRLVHGAVADFFSFHAAGYSWYVFNIADVAIVAGVVGLMYDCWREGREPLQS
ncbi:signal peptidase II [Rhodoligotrophos appendicifer]|uniref:signal peptidase II n=1 Tax=Rhodoligotrophos appendicifer TaxID=987056 RepID=UPI00118480FA|nr:signal peptidase II [Rhodoligotrophos appendicifer]